METATISPRNLKSLIILIVMCGSLVNGAFTVAQDSWIAILLIPLLYFPIILIYCRICSLLPGKSFFEIIDILFDPILKWLVIFLMTAYALMVSSFQLGNYVEFVVITALGDTPKVPLLMLLLIPAIYLAQKGLQILGRWSIIICTIIVFNIMLTILLSMNIVHLTYIQPVMDHSFREILFNSFTMGNIAVGDTVMVMIGMGYLKKEESAYKVYFSGVLVGILLFVVVMLRNITILGPYLEQSATFSTYMAVRVIDIGNFLERIESTISFTYIFLGITKLAVFLSAAAMGVSYLLKVPKYKRFLVPVSLLALMLSAVIYQSVFQTFELAWMYRYLALPFQVLVPLLIWITAEIKIRKKGTEIKENA